MFMTKSMIKAAVSSAALAPVYCATAVFAQSAGQIVSDSYAPPLVRHQASGLSIPAGTGMEAPAGAEQLHVTPSGLEVAGGFVELSAETAALEARVKGKRITADMLFTVARELEAAYAKQGFILVRVSLPPQTINDGFPLKLVVTDGHIENIDVSALPEKIQAQVAAVLKPLAGKRGVTRSEIERLLLLAADIPGVMLNSALKAGKDVGGTSILLGGSYKPVTANLSIDNGLSKNLGQYNVSLGADFNNILGLGEVFYLRLSGYPGLNGSFFNEKPRNRQVVAGVNLPLSTTGAWINLEAVDSKTTPVDDLPYGLEDHYQRFSSSLGYHWVRSRNFNTSSKLSFELVDADSDMNLLGSISAWTADKARVLRLSQTFDAYLPWEATLSGTATVSQGLDAFGARSGTSYLPLSRDGAKPEFTKLELSASYAQQVPVFSGGQSLQFSLTTKGQTSFGDALIGSEQMGLGGMNGLSAFNSGAIQGDSAALLRADFAFPMAMNEALQLENTIGQITPYFFVAGGVAKVANPTAMERGVTNAGAFGVGMRFGLSQSADAAGVNLSLEYARGKASDEHVTDRFNLRLYSTF